MNYIGSKVRLLPFLETGIMSFINERLDNMVFCDLFAGTGSVGRYFKKKVKFIISNDLEYYSYVINRNYVGNVKQIEFWPWIELLKQLKGTEGFIYNHYCKGGHGERNYFSDYNGLKIDACRQEIHGWKNEGQIDDDLYFFLLTSLIESSDKIANTASIYGAYLKHIKKTAQKEIIIAPAIFEDTSSSHQVYQSDANERIKCIKGDILYLDPPYNSRQYGANYHMLNTIAEYKEFIPKGKTGMRKYNRSNYCSTKRVSQSFEHLIQNAQFKYVFLSYNNEGLMSHDTIFSILRKHGKVELISKKYKRFMADKTENRIHKARDTNEFLFCLKKA